MKKILLLALAASAGLDLIPTSQASASTPVTQSGPVALPATVSNNYVVLVEGGRRYYRRRRYYWRGGRRVVVYDRVWL